MRRLRVVGPYRPKPAEHWWQHLMPQFNVSEFGHKHGGTTKAFWLFMGILLLNSAICIFVASMFNRPINTSDPLLNAISFPMLFLAFAAAAVFFKWKYGLTIMAVITIPTVLGFILR